MHEEIIRSALHHIQRGHLGSGGRVCRALRGRDRPSGRHCSRRRFGSS